MAKKKHKWHYLRLFFRKPTDSLFDSQPDWELQTSYYFGVKGTDLNLKEDLKAELKMRLMELHEQRKMSQRNIEMLWRAQILTAITTLISFLGIAIAIIALIISG